MTKKSHSVVAIVALVLLQPHRLRYVECVIHHVRVVREEQ